MGKDAKASRSLVLGRIGQDSGRRTSHREIKQGGDRERSHFLFKGLTTPLIATGAQARGKVFHMGWLDTESASYCLKAR